MPTVGEPTGPNPCTKRFPATTGTGEEWACIVCTFPTFLRRGCFHASNLCSIGGCSDGQHPSLTTPGCEFASPKEHSSNKGINGESKRGGELKKK